jgi:hypothetical protein
MKRLSTVRVVALFCSGLMAGLLFGDWLGPSFARSAMSVSSFIQFQQIVHINYLRTLPALSTLALAAPILWLVMLRHRRDSAELKVLLGGLSRSRLVTRSPSCSTFRLTISSRLGTWLRHPQMPERFGVSGKKHTWCGQFSGCSDFS